MSEYKFQTPSTPFKFRSTENIGIKNGSHFNFMTRKAGMENRPGPMASIS